MNGFPATGYGTWRQYRRRYEQARRENTSIFGVVCAHSSLCCPSCYELTLAFRQRHGPLPPPKHVTERNEVARRLAGIAAR